jgi:hypothetical protein
MKRLYYLAVLSLLTMNCMVLAAFCEEQSALAIYVHEGNLSGSMLSGVKVNGQDGGSNCFEGMTNDSGSATIEGAPGTWQFTFAKEGYQTLKLNYAVDKNDSAAVYLQKINQSKEQVALTVYVHEGSLNGSMLSGVSVSGKDAAGNSFEGTTGSDGSAVVSGQPGVWQFTLTKEGYGTLELKYDVEKTDTASAYLQKTS